MGRPKKRVNPDDKAVGVMIRGSQEWRDWLERLAEVHRTSVAGVIDRAVAEWAASQGFDEPAPKRLS